MADSMRMLRRADFPFEEESLLEPWKVEMVAFEDEGMTEEGTDDWLRANAENGSGHDGKPLCVGPGHALKRER
jgi:hypothetical protein